MRQPPASRSRPICCMDAAPRIARCSMGGRFLAGAVLAIAPHRRSSSSRPHTLSQLHGWTARAGEHASERQIDVLHVSGPGWQTGRAVARCVAEERGLASSVQQVLCEEGVGATDSWDTRQDRRQLRWLAAWKLPRHSRDASPPSPPSPRPPSGRPPAPAYPWAVDLPVRPAFWPPPPTPHIHFAPGSLLTADEECTVGSRAPRVCLSAIGARTRPPPRCSPSAPPPAKTAGQIRRLLHRASACYVLALSAERQARGVSVEPVEWLLAITKRPALETNSSVRTGSAMLCPVAPCRIIYLPTYLEYCPRRPVEPCANNAPVGLGLFFELVLHSISASLSRLLDGWDGRAGRAELCGRRTERTEKARYPHVCFLRGAWFVARLRYQRVTKYVLYPVRPVRRKKEKKTTPLGRGAADGAISFCEVCLPPVSLDKKGPTAVFILQVVPRVTTSLAFLARVSERASETANGPADLSVTEIAPLPEANCPSRSSRGRPYIKQLPA